MYVTAGHNLGKQFFLLVHLLKYISRIFIFTFIDLVFCLCARSGWLGGTSPAADLQVGSVAECGHR